MLQVRALVLASLRYWAAEYSVDGFCFLNAETLTLGALPHGWVFRDHMCVCRVYFSGVE